MSLVLILHGQCERGGEAVAKTSPSVVNRLAIAVGDKLPLALQHPSSCFLFLSPSSLTLRSTSSFSSLAFSSASTLARVFSLSFSVREPFPSLVLRFHADTRGPPGGCPTALSVDRTLRRQSSGSR